MTEYKTQRSDWEVMADALRGFVPDCDRSLTHAECERFVLYGAAHAADSDQSGTDDPAARHGAAGNLVEEAEAPFSQLPNDVFMLRWLGLGGDMDFASTMAAEQCEISTRPAERRVSEGWTADAP